MPAKSVIEQYAESREIDRLAVPLIPQFGIINAYLMARDAMVNEDCLRDFRRKEPPFRLTPPRGRA